MKNSFKYLNNLKIFKYFKYKYNLQYNYKEYQVIEYKAINIRQ